MTTYRRDIDGLRAIAVLAVVFSHAHVPGFGGGFVGVDIFFVISGFLITQILVKADGTLGQDILRFYERRVRRIAPALIAMLAASTAAAFLLFAPTELRLYSNSLLAATGFAANLFFQQSINYFNLQSLTPLLHLWSLGVEEQFYIVYPLALWATMRFVPRHLLVVLAAAFALSLGYSIWLAGFNPAAAFYSPFARAWELLFGALAALNPWRPILPWTAREALGAIALSLVAYAMATAGPDSLLPVTYLLPACAGTALAIALHDGRQTLVSRVLGSPPLVSVGLISYSLYLWHWPLFEFFERQVLHPPSPREYAMLIALALVLAWLSWRFVERPFRRAAGIRRGTLWLSAAACAALLLAAGETAIQLGGLPQRFAPPVAAAYARLADSFTRQTPDETCFVLARGDHYDFDRCFKLAGDRPNVVLWGDSHARNYWEGLVRPMTAAHIHLVDATYAGCAPNLTATAPGCRAFNQEVFNRLDRRRVLAVIMTGQFFRNREIIAPLRRTVGQVAAKGVRVVVLGLSLEFAEFEPFYLARYAQTGDRHVLDLAQSLIPQVVSGDDAIRSQLQGIAGLTYVSVVGAVCPAGRCPLTEDGYPIAFDRSHMTLQASVAFGALMWPQIRRAIGVAH